MARQRRSGLACGGRRGGGGGTESGSRQRCGCSEPSCGCCWSGGEIWNRSFCRPREQLVDIITEFPNEVEYIFRPSCVSLQRCGGCCGDEGLRCVPVQTSMVTVQVSTAPWGRGCRWAPGKLCTRGLPSSRCCRVPAQVPSQRGTYACSVRSSGRSGETSGGTDLSLPFLALSSVRGP
uniref:Placental growth factor n=1 Tax=Pavo cristatus TaxID=9049 RepID=A0A8C9FSC8_PAVCR